MYPSGSQLLLQRLQRRRRARRRIGIFSQGILRIPLLASLLDAVPSRAGGWWSGPVDEVAGWGLRPTTQRARDWAQRRGLPYLALEDGFLRSFGTGENFPPLSLVLDRCGIYYDCTHPSALEALLAGPRDVLAPNERAVRRLRERVVALGLSKYNHAPPLGRDTLRADDDGRVLVVDQTAGDMSVELGAASAASFEAMLAAALAENPQATIYIKTHPEVSAGRKRGYLAAVAPGPRVVLLREAVEPASLFDRMDRVYVVTSTLGFEALLAGKPVTCFGVPWYAGWGVTDDRQPGHPALRRRAPWARSVDELFAAACLHYARYLDPQTHGRGTIEHVIDWLALQRRMAARYPGRAIVVGFRRWKAANVRPMLSLFPEKVVFVDDAVAAASLDPQAGDRLICWGTAVPSGVRELAAASGARLLHMEDGFVRSVGLGSDLVAPRSFVLDEAGLYFDPGGPSDLETLLDTYQFDERDLQRARWVRAFICRHGITKYNLEPLVPVDWPSVGRTVVLVPGQVDDDASVRLGCDTKRGVHTNQALLQAARQAYPQAFIVYKPHPDVMSGNRQGRVAIADARRWADHLETEASVASCIEACDVVVTMTSLTGFDALLRGREVVVHGRPFYAGWGLTQDMLPLARRARTLTLDELVAGALLHYPLYWDPILRGYTTCEAVLRQLLNERQRLDACGQLERLRTGKVRRQWRKLAAHWRAWRTSI